MNGRTAKKLRKISRHNWRDYYMDILALPLRERLAIAWAIITNYRGK